MLGFEPTTTEGDGLLHTRPQFSTREQKRSIAAAVILLLALVLFLQSPAAETALLGLSCMLPGCSPAPMRWYGVTLGGWLVMEINPTKADGIHPDQRPSWMFDQIDALSELDFITALRKEHGDAFAIATMTNHWGGYYTDESLDAAQALGVNSVRIPLGYWIVDSPVGGGSPEETGFSPEGFVTGGLLHLKRMLIKLKRRKMTALLDLHSHPCNSACVSNGLACLGPLAFTPNGGAQLYDDVIVNTIGDIPRCAGGVYKTTRTPSKAASTWGQVAVNAVGSLAAWVAALPEEATGAVAALQLANEPALGPPGIFDDEINRFYDRALAVARAHLPATPLLMSFMHPLPRVIDFLHGAAAKSAQLGGAGAEILADHHYYLNWQCPVDAPFDWGEIHRRACQLEAEEGARDVDVYASEGMKIIIGEWSIATNHDEKRDLGDPQTVRHLSQLYAEQLDIFSRKPNVIGSFFWTLRMGSGWDPRPTEAHPHGRQVEGTSAFKSLPDYPFGIWSLMEMMNAGVATPLNRSYAGACK